MLTDFPETRESLLVRVRSPRGFHAALGRLVLEEWFDVAHLATVDGTTGAVLSYLLGGQAR